MTPHQLRLRMHLRTFTADLGPTLSGNEAFNSLHTPGVIVFMSCGIGSGRGDGGGGFTVNTSPEMDLTSTYCGHGSADGGGIGLLLSDLNTETP